MPEIHLLSTAMLSSSIRPSIPTHI